MKHLFPFSVYHEEEYLPEGTDALSSIVKAGADGIELLTGYSSVDPSFRNIAKGVHLPYSTDWYSGWTGTADTEGLTDDEIKFIYYGSNRDEISQNLRSAITHASKIDPAYGVLHAGSVRLDDIFANKRTYSDRDVIDGLADMINAAVSEFPNGEPPFTILFENMWWPGVKLLDDGDMKLLEQKLEFTDWGFCLDTGHMMNALGNCRDEDAAEQLLCIFSEYSDEMKSRVKTMHLHFSASADYTRSLVPQDVSSLSVKEKLSKAYGLVCNIDQHRPFSDSMCIDMVEMLRPDFVTHEISSPSWDYRISDFSKQRKFFC